MESFVVGNMYPSVLELSDFEGDYFMKTRLPTALLVVSEEGNSPLLESYYSIYN